MELMKDYEYVIDSHAGKANVVVDIYNRKSSSSFAQIWAIQTSMRNELRSLITYRFDNRWGQSLCSSLKGETNTSW